MVTASSTPEAVLDVEQLNAREFGCLCYIEQITRNLPETFNSHSGGVSVVGTTGANQNNWIMQEFGFKNHPDTIRTTKVHLLRDDSYSKAISLLLAKQAEVEQASDLEQADPLWRFEFFGKLKTIFPEYPLTIRQTALSIRRAVKVIRSGSLIEATPSRQPVS